MNGQNFQRHLPNSPYLWKTSKWSQCKGDNLPKIAVQQGDTDAIIKHYFQNKIMVKETDIREMFHKNYNHKFFKGAN